jgi:hypothetical protein
MEIVDQNKVVDTLQRNLEEPKFDGPSCESELVRLGLCA